MLMWETNSECKVREFNTCSGQLFSTALSQAFFGKLFGAVFQALLQALFQAHSSSLSSFQVQLRSLDPNDSLTLMMRRIFIIFSIMVLYVVAKNTSTDIDKPLTQHPLHKGWLFHSLIGILGIILNSLVIVILYLERGSLVSSVNVMIMSELIFIQSKKYFNISDYQVGGCTATSSMYFHTMESFLFHAGYKSSL